MRRRFAAVVVIGILVAAAALMCHQTRPPSEQAPVPAVSTTGRGALGTAGVAPAPERAGETEVLQEAAPRPSVFTSANSIPAAAKTLPPCCLALAKIERASDLLVQRALQVCLHHAKQSTPRGDLRAAVREVLGKRTPKGCR